MGIFSSFLPLRVVCLYISGSVNKSISPLFNNCNVIIISPLFEINLLVYFLALFLLALYPF